MTPGRAAVLQLLVGASVLVFAVALFSPPAPGTGGAVFLTWFGALTKMALQAVAFVLAHRCASAFDAGAPVRRAWRLLSLGFLSLLLGQACLAPYQLLWGIPTPFPSPADVFFFASYPLFFASLLVFLRAYAEAGFAVGTPAQRWLLAAGMALLCLLVALPMLRPVAQAGAPALETFLNLAYPILDFALLIPVALLIRNTLAFRGGEIARVWTTLLAGFVCMCAGDIFYAYLTALGKSHLDPLVHATFIASYGLMALGSLRQRRLQG